MNTLATNNKNENTLLSDYSAPNKYFGKSKQEAAMFVLGMGLHTVQDSEAHFKKHNSNASDIVYYDNWKEVNPKTRNGEVIIVRGNKRITNTEKLTKEYINYFMSYYGNKLFEPYAKN